MVSRVHGWRIELGAAFGDSIVEYGKWSHAWWCMPVIPALGKLRQENHEFKVSLSYIETLTQK
jgi:hypothetical protein